MFESARLVDALLPNGVIGKIKLDDYKGKIVLIVFYSADFTEVSRTSMLQLKEKYSMFAKLNCQASKRMFLFNRCILNIFSIFSHHSLDSLYT